MTGTRRQTVLLLFLLTGALVLTGCPSNVSAPGKPAFTNDGIADDGDPGNGPAKNYPPGLVAADNATQANSAPVNCTTLTGRAVAIPGPNAKTNSAYAHSNNKVECTFSVSWNWWRKTTISYEIVTPITIAKISGDGTGKVFGTARITDSTGQMVNATTYNYDIKVDPTNPSNTLITGPGAAGALALPAVFTPPANSVAGSVSLKPGDYTLMFEMNIQATARDGVADVAATSGLTIH